VATKLRTAQLKHSTNKIELLTKKVCYKLLLSL